MEKYNGNQKGFIYASCDAKNQEEVFSNYLEPLAKDGVSFWWADGFDSKEEKTLARAGALLLFLTKDYVKESKLRDAVAAAVRNDKPIMSVYLEDVELDAGLSMQLESQQALFRSRYKSDEEFTEALGKAAIFDRIEVSEQQKGRQKSRSIIAIAAAVVAVLVLAIVIRPMLGSKANADTMEALGLQGLSKEELESIEELRIVGTEIVKDDVEAEYEEGNTDRILVIDPESDEVISTVAHGDISDLSGIEQMKNLRILRLDGQQIEDITPILELENLEYLTLACNPVSSLDGLENLNNLKRLDVAYTNIEELPDGMSVEDYRANGSELRKIPDFGGIEDIFFSAGDADHVSDVSNIGSAASYVHLHIDCADAPADQINEGLKGIPVSDELGLCDIQINSLQELDGIDTENLTGLHLGGSSIRSLDGIEHFEGIEELILEYCDGLTDLSQVNRLQSLKKLRISSDMEGMADAVDDRIEIEIVD